MSTTRPNTRCRRCDQALRLHWAELRCPDGSGRTFQKRQQNPAVQSFSAAEVEWMATVLAVLRRGGEVGRVLVRKPECAGWARKVKTMKEQVARKSDEQRKAAS